MALGDAFDRPGHADAAAVNPGSGGSIVSFTSAFPGRSASAREEDVAVGMAAGVDGSNTPDVADYSFSRRTDDLGKVDRSSENSGADTVRVLISTSKYPGMVAIIDAADAPLVAGMQWNFSPGKPGRELTHGCVVRADAGRDKTSLARTILQVTDREALVTHANGDKLDCRRANLVTRTRSEVAKGRKAAPETIAALRPYPDPERAGVYRVPIKSHRYRREALIDAADLPLVAGRNWNWSTRSDGATAGKVLLATTGRQTPLARLIAGANGVRARVRHLNGDALDCRRENLAVITPGEQSGGNRKIKSRKGRTCTSVFKGVARDAERSKWLVQINKDGIHHPVGRFDDEQSAARAYDAASRVLFGRSGYLNFPDEPTATGDLLAARAALEELTARTRETRRRQRGLERLLRAALQTLCAVDAAEPADDVELETAQQWFDVTANVWRRWERFGWVPTARRVDGREMIALPAVERLLKCCGLNVLPYPDPGRPGVWRVPLAGERTDGREALIDADAVPLVRVRRWRFAERVAGRGGEVQTMIPRENIRLHYVVMRMTAEAQAFHIGHRNDDPLDCRRENLVVRTLTDTSANRRKQATWNGRPCTSQYKGVCYLSRRERWHASIKKDRVKYRLGTFRDEIAAAEAYDEAARRLFGEHARVNFPDGIDTALERMAA